MRDAIGSRGEAICHVLLTKSYPGRDILFRPHFLGDKWPNADFLVELIGVTDIVAFFFVQVRSTREGYTKRNRRLKVKVTRENVAGLASYPAPTYIVGIDEIDEIGYLVSVNGENLTGLSSMNTRFPLNDATRNALWNEVRNYWGTLTHPKLASAFQDSLWR